MSNWKDISTAPKDGTWFLYCDKFGFISAAMYEDGGFYGDHGSCSRGNPLHGSITHWMPLPELPEIK